MERAETLSAKKNPYFTHAEAELFLARRAGRVVGRISAQICRLEQERRPGIGHFGWLDAEDDPAIFRALLDSARDWAKARGMTLLRGPFSFSTNEETGLLVDGFSARPMLMMPYHPAYAGNHVEAAGFAKVKDVIAYRIRTDEYRSLGSARRSETPDDLPFTLRALDMSRFAEELAKLLAIFNDSWSENWGMVPFTAPEIAAAARSLKPLIDPELVAIAEIAGEPIAMLICLPNLMEAIRDCDGRLFPFGLVKLLWRLKGRRIHSARVPLAGIKRRYHGTILGASLLPLMFDRIRRQCRQRGIDEVEMSWILEDNLPMRRLIEGIGGQAYKTYRLYDTPLA